MSRLLLIAAMVLAALALVAAAFVFGAVLRSDMWLLEASRRSYDAPGSHDSQGGESSI
jgi:hypothetical protein